MGFKLAELFVEFTAKGVDALQGTLGKVKDSLAQLEEGAARVGRVATYAFAGLTGVVGGFVRAGLAGSVQMEALSAQMQRLSREIAGIFLPQFTKVIDLVARAADWFQNLSGEQQQNIARWIEAAGAALAVAMVLPKVITAIKGVGMGVQLLTAVFGAFDVATGGILPALGAIVTALLALGAGVLLTEDGFGGIMQALKPLMAAFGQLAKIAMQALQPIIDLAGSFAQAVGGVLLEAMQSLKPAFASLSSLIGPLSQALQPLLEIFLAIAQRAAASLGRILPVLAAAFGKIADMVGRVLTAMEPLVDLLFDIWEAQEDQIMELIPPLVELTEALVELLVPAIRLTIAGLKPLIGFFVKVVSVVSKVVGWLVKMAAHLIRISGIAKGLNAAADAAGGGEMKHVKHLKVTHHDLKHPKDIDKERSHQAPTLARTGSEAITATISRLQQAALKQDWQKQQLETQKSMDAKLGQIAKNTGQRTPALFAH